MDDEENGIILFEEKICEDCIFAERCTGLLACDDYSEEFDDDYFDFYDDLDDDGYTWTEMSYRRYKEVSYKWDSEPTEWEMFSE